MWFKLVLPVYLFMEFLEDWCQKEAPSQIRVTGLNWFFFPQDQLPYQGYRASLPYYLQVSLNKFPDFFHMGTFIDSALMKL